MQYKQTSDGDGGKADIVGLHFYSMRRRVYTDTGTERRLGANSQLTDDVR